MRLVPEVLRFANEVFVDDSHSSGMVDSSGGGRGRDHPTRHPTWEVCKAEKLQAGADEEHTHSSVGATGRAVPKGVEAGGIYRG